MLTQPESHSLTSSIALFVSRKDSIASTDFVRYESLLSASELARAKRFARPADRQRYILGRALLRTTLAGFLGCEPIELEFRIGEHGKPELDPGYGAQGDELQVSGEPVLSALSFNLSHARDFVVLAVTRAGAVGVDIEDTSRSNDVLAIADRYFFGVELDELLSWPADQQREKFFSYWTLKEAYMKARGEGIALGLGNFGFLLRHDAIELIVADHLKDEPAAWFFTCGDPVDDYRLAIACRSRESLQINCFESVPLNYNRHLDWDMG